MRVFVAGASGAIGRPLVRQLVAAGHDVTGMTRREGAAEEVRAAGAEGAVCDVFDPAALNAAVAAAILDLERQVLEAEGMEGLVLRYGFFYGLGTHYARNAWWADEFRKRRFPIVGGGTGVTSFVHVDDAATATVAAVERGAPGIYNVCDDDPAPVREWIPAYAQAVGAKRPFRVPRWLARIIAGKAIAEMATTTRGASNAKAKRELGGAPLYKRWRRGFRKALG